MSSGAKGFPGPSCGCILAAGATPIRREGKLAGERVVFLRGAHPTDPARTSRNLLAGI